jgi:hypothetical protein
LSDIYALLEGIGPHVSYTTVLLSNPPNKEPWPHDYYGIDQRRPSVRLHDRLQALLVAITRASGVKRSLADRVARLVFFRDWR